MATPKQMEKKISPSISPPAKAWMGLVGIIRITISKIDPGRFKLDASIASACGTETPSPGCTRFERTSPITMAQRLVRTICPECKADYYPPKEVLKALGCNDKKQVKLSRGKGCSQCYDSGFKGRTGIYELFEMDEGLQSLILTNPTIDVLQEFLRENGQGTLKSMGYDKVLERNTTIEEVQRVTSVEA